MPIRPPDFPTIHRTLVEHDPTRAEMDEDGYLEAAVALVFHEPGPGRAPELLFIERAQREGDPWSGQMAFPGGRRERRDPHLAATASRETLEEVGLALGDPVARLDDFSGSRNPRVPPLVVAPYVYYVPERPKLQINHEVASTVWIPIDWMLHDDSAIEYRFERPEFSGLFPAIEYQGYVVWGLTYRILTNLFTVLGHQLPAKVPLAPHPTG